MQPGSAPPSGSVHFFVGGQDLPAAVDPNTGRATLNHVLPPGPQTVTATYSGDGRYTATSEALVRKDPTLQRAGALEVPEVEVGLVPHAGRHLVHLPAARLRAGRGVPGRTC